MGLGPNPGPTPAWRCLREGDLKETQGSGRVGMGRTEARMQRFRRRSYRRRLGVREEERKERERGHLGTSWGAQMGTGQEVEQWQSEDGRAVSGEVDVRRLGRKRVAALMQGPEQGVR